MLSSQHARSIAGLIVAGVVVVILNRQQDEAVCAAYCAGLRAGEHLQRAAEGELRG